MEESQRSPAPSHSSDEASSAPSSRQGTPKPALHPQTTCPSGHHQQLPVYVTDDDLAQLLPAIWVPPRDPQPGEADKHEVAEIPSETHPDMADSVKGGEVPETEVGVGDEGGEDANETEAEEKEEDGEGKEKNSETETGGNAGDEQLPPKQETPPRKNSEGESGPTTTTTNTTATTTTTTTTTTTPTLDKQMLIDALEFYSRVACRDEALAPIDRTMSIAELMDARQSVLVQIPLAHVHVMAKSKALLQYAQRMQRGLEVTDQAKELLQDAGSRLSVAREMQLILFLCTVRAGDSRPDMKYRDLEMTLLDVLDPRTTPLLIREDSVYEDALSSGRWGAVKKMYEQGEELGPGDVDKVCLLAAMTQDWAVFLDCAARDANILGTPETAEYLQKLEEEGGAWKDRYGVGAEAWKGCSPLHNALRSGRCPMRRLAVLIDVDQELANAVDLSGDSLLHAAVQGMDAEAVGILLRCQADVNVKDAQRRTPLQLVMTAATKLVAPDAVKPEPATPKASAASTEEQASTESGGGPAAKKGEMPPQERDESSEEGEEKELSKAIDVMVSLVTVAGRSGQVIEWPAGDNGWTALHILCAAGGHQHLQNFIRHGANPYTKQQGNSLIDCVVQQKSLTVDQKMKTLHVLIRDQNMTDFQGVVPSDLRPQTQRQPPCCVAGPPADPTPSEPTTPDPGSSSPPQGDAAASPVQTAAAQNTGDGRRTSDNPYNLKIFGESDSDSDSDSSAEFEVDPFHNRVETILKMENIPSLRQSGLLSSILHHLQLRDKPMVHTLVKAALERAERPAQTAQELKEVFRAFDCKKTQRTFSRYTKRKAARTRTVEAAYNRRDFVTVMQLGRSGAALAPRELTLVMLAASQQGHDPELFYHCFERGGLLDGIPYQPRKENPSAATAEVPPSQQRKKRKAVPSPLHGVLRKGSFSLSELVQRTGIALLEHIQSAERKRSSLLHFHVDNLDNLVFLLTRGADINAAGDAHGHSVVQRLIELRQGQAMVKLVRLAVELGQTIDWTPHCNGWTALHVLAASGACEDLLFCVKHGADPTVLRPRRHDRQDDFLSCRHHHCQRRQRHRQRKSEGRAVTGRQGRVGEKGGVEGGEKGEVEDGLTLIDTVLLQPAISEAAKLPVLRVLLEDLHLGPLHARVVDARPAGPYSEGGRRQQYRYPVEAALQPSMVTARSRHAILQVVQLMVRHGAVGEVERGVVLGKMEEYRKLPFCQPALDFLVGGQGQSSEG